MYVCCTLMKISLYETVRAKYYTNCKMQNLQQYTAEKWICLGHRGHVHIGCCLMCCDGCQKAKVWSMFPVTQRNHMRSIIWIDLTRSPRDAFSNDKNNTDTSMTNTVFHLGRHISCHSSIILLWIRTKRAFSWRLMVTTLAAATIGVWNSLPPANLRTAELSYTRFRRSLKTFWFRQFDHCALWTFLFNCAV